MVKKEGKIPCNARIDVDYTGDKPKVKFGYTSKHPKKDAEKQARLSSSWFLIWIIICIPFLIFSFMDGSYESYPTECGNLSVNISNHIVLDPDDNYFSVYGFNLTCDNQTRVFKFNNEKTSGISPHFYETFPDAKNELMFIGISFFYPFLALFIAFFLNSLLTKYLVNKKWFQKWLPKAMADGKIFKTKIKKYYKFKPKDVLERVIIIPQFSNIELDYKTKGDFSKYLEKIKIREYRSRKITVKTKKLKKLKVDPFTWYAIFYFSKKPRDGYLEVIYQ